MSDATKIEWADATWNPIRAGTPDVSTPWGYHCERISPGCKNCYAATMNKRMLPAWGTGLDYTVPNREKVEIFLNEKELMRPLHWKKPRSIFPCSMTDWCADFVTDNSRNLVMMTAANCPQHRFLFLTKRADNCANYVLSDARVPSWMSKDFMLHPLPNVWLGFSAENQEYFDARWEHMRKLAAAGWNVWCSAEPLLGPIDLKLDHRDSELSDERRHGLSWVVVGGESGHGARPFNIQWARDLIRKCRDSGTACFVKQLGAKPYVSCDLVAHPFAKQDVKDRKGGDMSEWPEDLRVREVPR